MHHANSSRIQHALPIALFAGLAIMLLDVTRAESQQIYDELRFTPRAPRIERHESGRSTLAAPAPPTFQDATINAGYIGRVGVFGDSTRMADFSNGFFLPSAIPAAGQDYFHSGWRAGMQGDGSAIRISSSVPLNQNFRVAGHAQLLVNNLGFNTAGAQSGGNFAIRQAFGQINKLSVGVMETALADPSATPETLDVAGPNARITVNPAGLGSGQGRLSYDFFNDPADGGFTYTVSLEQPQPGVIDPSLPTVATYSNYPDLVSAAQYVSGYKRGNIFVEKWHFQWSNVCRSIGIESNDAVHHSAANGWGTVLSGAYYFDPRGSFTTSDRVMFSIAGGQGISHYITDLNNTTDANDAARDAGGTLKPLPVIAWYAAYTHNWCDRLRSTATYSRVDLDNILPFGSPGTARSPYRSGQYTAVNLVYHRPFSGIIAGEEKRCQLFTGLEYLYGHKETLDGSSGDAHRIMWVTTITN